MTRRTPTEFAVLLLRLADEQSFACRMALQRGDQVAARAALAECMAALKDAQVALDAMTQREAA